MTQSVVPAVDDRWIYHFTHIDNLEAIRTAGILRCDAVAREGMTRTEVGAADIKESRRRRTIPIEPGGRVGEYVPFYFAPRSPMMYRIACDRRDSIPNRYAGGRVPDLRRVAVERHQVGRGAQRRARVSVGALLQDHALEQRILSDQPGTTGTSGGEEHD
ncbi:DUF4433 domain-containing protein [Actinoplanes auranticolor]|uniref:DarT domain-containing protein n=1 Tax=Actinoplanes auranticolor TaxID=47988 RepID=A0A919S647_9ACTN|nr:DUF4433 domain-containing protein [Actinoplanes auranticolor]GIM65336.1 hypothetical protein Aau02nite_16320 [Actinoplanes auranticolor]